MLASANDGETWDSGGDIWLVMKRRSDGKVVVFSDELAGVYASLEETQSGNTR